MLSQRCRNWVDDLWYGKNRLRYLLWPISLLFQAVVWVRRRWLTWRCEPLSVPVIVVGNLTVGGVGKTPLVIALAQYFRTQGLRVGIVSRGYGAHIHTFPHCVGEEDAAWLVGDEPKLLALKTQCPVVIAPNRLHAVQYLLQHYQSQLIISDDGLQHYAMPRQIEIAVIDGARGMGSGMCLPAGPLRESVSRLQQVDFIVVNSAQTVHTPYENSYHMTMEADLPHSFTGQSLAWDKIEMPCSAVAGMGHPERFFALLSQLGVVFQPYKFADHHEFTPEDLACLQQPVIMTEKDAVKCCAFATDAMYYLPVEAKLSDEFWTKIWSQIKTHVHSETSLS